VILCFHLCTLPFHSGLCAPNLLLVLHPLPLFGFTHALSFCSGVYAPYILIRLMHPQSALWFTHPQPCLVYHPLFIWGYHHLLGLHTHYTDSGLRTQYLFRNMHYLFLSSLRILGFLFWAYTPHFVFGFAPHYLIRLCTTFFSLTRFLHSSFYPLLGSTHPHSCSYLRLFACIDVPFYSQLYLFTCSFFYLGPHTLISCLGCAPANVDWACIPLFLIWVLLFIPLLSFIWFTHPHPCLNFMHH
jgi:hypothetical protein